MIETGERLLLVGEDREYFVTAGEGQFSTDRGTIDLSALPGMNPGDEVRTHLGVPFIVLRPRPTDFFVHAKRSGAPMLPKDIGLVIAYTGMNRDDTVLDAGTGSGVAAIYFGNIARHVKTCEVRPEFAALAEKNIRNARLENVRLILFQRVLPAGVAAVDAPVAAAVPAPARWLLYHHAALSAAVGAAEPPAMGAGLGGIPFFIAWNHSILR